MIEKRYKAFISYSHQNEKFARWLHRSLEGYIIPKELFVAYPHLAKKLYPIFRDREELPSSSNLGNNILDALKNSEYLIVICSMASAQSFWVNQEIIDFKSLHGEERVLAIILDGEPNALSKGTFSDKLECFPEALKYKVCDGKLTTEQTEPIAADARKGKDGRKFARLKLIAGLLGIGLEELYQREVKRERRNKWIGILFTLFILGFISLLALNLFFEKNRAELETLKVKELLFKQVLEKGFTYRDYFKNLLKAKHIFAHAITIATNRHQKNMALILYKSLESRVKLSSSAINKRHYTQLIEEQNQKNLTLKEHEEEVLFCCDKENLTFYLKNKKKNNVLYKFTKPTIYYDKGRRRLDQQVQDVFFINNGREVVSWDYGNNINIWTREEPLPIEVFNHGGQIKGILFSKDEKEFLSWGNNAKVKLWARGKKDPLFEFKHNDWVTGAIFTQDEQRILSWSNNGSIKLWSRYDFFPFKERALLSLSHEDSVNGAVFTKDEKEILSYSDDRTAKLWSINSNRAFAILKHQSRVMGAKFIENEKKIISWSDDAEVKVWEFKHKALLEVDFDYKDGVNNDFWRGGFSDNGENIFYWNLQGQVRFYNKKTKELLFKLNQEEYLTGASLSRSQMKILSWDAPTDERTVNTRVITSIGQIKVWSIDKAKPLAILKHDKPILGTKFNQSEGKVLSWSKDKTLKLWNINKDKPLLVLKSKDAIFDAQFYNNEQELLSCSIKGEIRLWNIQDGSSIVLVDFKENEKIHGVSFSTNLEKILLWNLDNSIYLWNKNRKNFQKIINYKDWVYGSTFTKNNQEVLSWSRDGTIKLWSIKSNKTLLHLKHSTSPVFGAIFNKNEKLILSWSPNGVVKLWSREHVHSLFTLVHKGSIFEAKFSEDEQSILIMSQEGELREYELYPKKRDSLSDYALEVEVESGTSLNEIGELVLQDSQKN